MEINLHYITYIPGLFFSLLWVAVNNKNSDINIFLQKDYIFFSPYIILAVFLLIKNDISQVDFGSGRHSVNSVVGFSANQFTNNAAVFLFYTFILLFEKSKYYFSKILFISISLILIYYSIFLSIKRRSFCFFISVLFYLVFSRIKFEIKYYLPALSKISVLVYANNVTKGSVLLRFTGYNTTSVNDLSSFDSGRSLINNVT